MTESKRAEVKGVMVNVWPSRERLGEFNLTFIRRSICERTTIHASGIDDAWEKALAALSGKRQPAAPNLAVVEAMRKSVKHPKKESTR